MCKTVAKFSNEKKKYRKGHSTAVMYGLLKKKYKNGLLRQQIEF